MFSKLTHFGEVVNKLSRIIAGDSSDEEHRDDEFLEESFYDGGEPDDIKLDMFKVPHDTDFRISDNYYWMTFSLYSSLNQNTETWRFMEKVGVNICIPVVLLFGDDSGALQINLQKLLSISNGSRIKSDLLSACCVSITFTGISTNVPISHEIGVSAVNKESGVISQDNLIEPVTVIPYFEVDRFFHNRLSYKFLTKSGSSEAIVYSQTDPSGLLISPLFAQYSPHTIQELTEFSKLITINDVKYIMFPKTKQTVTLMQHINARRTPESQKRPIEDFGDNARYMVLENDFIEIKELLKMTHIPIAFEDLTLTIKPKFYATWYDAVNSEEKSKVDKEIGRYTQVARSHTDEFGRAADEQEMIQEEDAKAKLESITNGFRFTAHMTIVYRKI